MRVLCEAVRRLLCACGLCREGARLVCGVSGGADSVALLHALCRVRAQAGYTLYAVHVQHGLRAEASLEDERFVRSLCRVLSVELLVETLSLPGDMDTPGMETMAREARRCAFARAVRQTQAQALVLAHHRDDQTETVLMHLLRGSGAGGLCGMRERIPFEAGGWLLRPFLDTGKAHILEALASEGLTFREDESNARPVTARNALRLSVLPMLETLFPGASANVARAARALWADEDWLSGQTEALYVRAAYERPPFCALRLQALLPAHAAVQRRVLRRAWLCAARRAGMPDERALSYEDTLALEALLQAPCGSARSLPGGVRAVRTACYVHIQPEISVCLPQEPEQLVRPGNTDYTFDHSVFAQQDAEAGGPVPRDCQSVVLSPEVLALSPVLRLPEPGDRVRPLGAPGSKPLRRFFTDRKADPFLRRRLPVLAVGGEVLWVPRLCVSERLRLTDVPAGCVRLTLVSHPDLLKE